MRRALATPSPGAGLEEQAVWDRAVQALPPKRGRPKLYELFVLRRVVDTLAELFPGWRPRYPPADQALPRILHYRLALPDGHGELIWQPIYPDTPELPLWSLSFAMRPDLSLERDGRLFVMDAKYGFKPDAPARNLAALHVYRDGIVQGDGSREATAAAVAVTAHYGRRYERFYRREYFALRRLGLVHLPAGDLARKPEGDRLSLREALTAFLTM